MTITASDILNTVIKLGKEFPDRQANCQYFNDDDDKTPCCIVGHAFDLHGIDAEKLRKIAGGNYNYEELNKWTGVGAGALSVVGIEIDSVEAEERLQEIQREQDLGAPWGVAIAEKQ